MSVPARRCGLALLALVVAWGTTAGATDGDAAGRVRAAMILAYQAAMGGRKAETLAAVHRASGGVSASEAAALPGGGWPLTAQYAALIRFGLWDEMIAIGPPPASARGLTAGYLYGRGVALASRGRLDAARDTLAQLEALAQSTRDPALRAPLAVAVPILAARIAASAGDGGGAVARLAEAVAAEDRMPPEEPPAWFFPARHLLGAQLLIDRRPADAERVYRDDLARHPDNGWSLYGLAAALTAQGRGPQSAIALRRYETAWRDADVHPPPGSAFWFAGVDEASCECQRPRVPVSGQAPAAAPGRVTAPAGGS